MLVLIVTEKILGILLFACLNFTIPFGVSWVKPMATIFFGLMFIDSAYGRIVAYSLIGTRMGRNVEFLSRWEGLILPVTLLISYCVIGPLSTKADNLLFEATSTWRSLGVCQLIASLLVALGFMVYSEFSEKSTKEISASSIDEGENNPS